MKRRDVLFAVGMILCFVVLGSFALADDDGFNVPLGVETITYIRSETSNTTLYQPDHFEAIAGNLTEITISGVSPTKSWQGFFGNVSGTLILEDSSGFRFYDWAVAEPQGEVFASVNNTITWTSVECAPIEDVGYRTEWHDFYGMLDTDYDDLSDTYNETNHGMFQVGFENITGCRTTYTFQNNASQAENFPAVLLTSDDNTTLIFTAILEDNTSGVRDSLAGYDGGLYDFQLLVAENGQLGNTVTTRYYFWIEIE